jgi:FMN-dependent oxidoreductase (nitrilotriacetate monooxygenase family)
MTTDGPGSRPGATKTMHLGLNLIYGGNHVEAWRAPYAAPLGAYSLDQWTHLAELAEGAALDALFMGDLLSVMGSVAAGPTMAYDPTVLLAALAQKTSRIGLIGTASTTFEEPYNLARRFASLDHLSAGRAAWNIVTSLDPNTIANYGATPGLDKEQRYARAMEFVDVVCSLWDSWEDEALVGDQRAGVFADPDRVHAIDHHGEFFDVRGPLMVPRPVQGRPVLFQAGGSAGGVELAARHADVVFCASVSLGHMQAFADRLRARLRAHGRGPDDVRILPGLGFTLGGTEEEARRRRADLDELGGAPQLGVLAYQLGVEVEALSLDSPIPRALLDAPPPEGAVEGVREMILSLAREQNLTVREILASFSKFHRQVTGTPEQLADTMEEWFRSGAVSGFNLMPDEMVTGTEAFVEHVLPILRRRGLFREGYAGSTLREHLGLSRPAGRFTADRQPARV